MIMQFVVGVVTICVISASFFVLYCILFEIGKWFDPSARSDTESFLLGLIALFVVVLFVSIVMVIGGVVIPFLGIKG